MFKQITSMWSRGSFLLGWTKSKLRLNEGQQGTRDECSVLSPFLIKPEKMFCSVLACALWVGGSPSFEKEMVQERKQKLGPGKSQRTCSRRWNWVCAICSLRMNNTGSSLDASVLSFSWKVTEKSSLTAQTHRGFGWCEGSECRVSPSTPRLPGVLVAEERPWRPGAGWLPRRWPGRARALLRALHPV